MLYPLCIYSFIYLYYYLFLITILYNICVHTDQVRGPLSRGSRPDLSLEDHFKWEKGLDFFCVGIQSYRPVVFIIQDSHATTCHHLFRYVPHYL